MGFYVMTETAGVSRSVLRDDRTGEVPKMDFYVVMDRIGEVL